MWMRPALLALVATVAAGQELEGTTRRVAGPEDRIYVVVPERWTDQAPAGNVIVSVKAPGPYGGHTLTIVRDEGQGDADRQRERYLEHDSSKSPEAVARKLTEPFFGYRLDDPEHNRVFVRAFATDGADGIVLTVSSRYRFYDKFHAETVLAIAASLVVESSGTRDRPELGGQTRRIFDKSATASLVVPGAWKSLDTELDADLMFLGFKGVRSGPRLVLRDWGGPSNAALTLVKVASQWRKAYSGIEVTRMSGDPPRMLVRNRVPGSVEYLIAFEHEDRGFTLGLTVREGGFERFRPAADLLAKSLVFTDAPYRPPEAVPGDVRKVVRNLAEVHASAEHVDAAERTAKELSGFARGWKRIGVGGGKDTAPFAVVLTEREDFAEVANHFGEPPSAYDRLGRKVVTVPPPEDKERLARWRGLLYAALTENALHRDLTVPAPPWLRAGLCACMDAAGRSGGIDEAHPALVKSLELKISTDRHKPLEQILEMTNADLYLAETPELRAQAWGYLHLMLFGKGVLSGYYKRWVRELAKATRGPAAPLDLKAYEKARKDLAKHVLRRWGT